MELFCEGLRRLGYEPVTYPDHPTYVTFDFEIPAGAFAGQRIKAGVNVPDDFPTIPPSGPHFSPALVEDDNSGQPPRGALHPNHDATFKSLTGDDWQYWSRPYPAWKTFADPVRAYLAHMKRLWALIK